jgi:hypothetical protein
MNLLAKSLKCVCVVGAALDAAALVVERLAALAPAEPQRIGITARLTPELHERLRRAAFDMREAKGKVIERAIIAFLDQRAKPAA